jgi:hypothetical protein
VSSQRSFVVGEMNVLVNDISTFDEHGNDTVGALRDTIHNSDLIEKTGHWEVVVSWNENEVRNIGCTDNALQLCAKSERYIAHLDGQARRVWDEGVCDEVWSAGCGGEIDTGVSYVEACEAVET